MNAAGDLLRELDALAYQSGLTATPAADDGRAADRVRTAFRRAITMLTGGCGRMEWCEDCQRHVPHGWLHTRTKTAPIATDPAVLPPGTWLARGAGEGDAYALRWFTHPDHDPDEVTPWLVLDCWGVHKTRVPHAEVTGWTVLIGTPDFPNWRP